MSTAPHTARWTRHLGHASAKLVKEWTRLECSAASYLVRQGVPSTVVKTILLIPKLLVLGALLYVAFWAALFILALAVGILLIANTNTSRHSETGEWRDGWMGYGYYVDDERVAQRQSPDDH